MGRATIQVFSHHHSRLAFRASVGESMCGQQVAFGGEHALGGGKSPGHTSREQLLSLLTLHSHSIPSSAKCHWRVCCPWETGQSRAGRAPLARVEMVLDFKARSICSAFGQAVSLGCPQGLEWVLDKGLLNSADPEEVRPWGFCPALISRTGFRWSLGLYAPWSSHLQGCPPGLPTCTSYLWLLEFMLEATRCIRTRLWQ